jgi:hypothetical protein
MHMPKKVSLDGGASTTKEAKGKGGGGEEKNKKLAMIAIAVVCLLAAGGVTAFQMGLIGGGEPKLTVEEMGVPVEDTITDPVEKKKYVDRMRIIEERQKNMPSAGS